MTMETQAAFARRINRDRSYVTRLKQGGRLVMAGDGKLVDVEASMKRLSATESNAPNHHGVRDHWEEQRTAPPASANDRAVMNTETIEKIGVKTKFEMLRKLQADADRAQWERDLLREKLVERGQIERAMGDEVAVILGALENMPDRLAPQLQNVDDLDRIRARIQDELEQYQYKVSDELGRVGVSSDKGQA